MTTEWAVPAPPPRGTRPRNRRQLILAAAAELFATRGYAQVSMADVAAAVAVGPSALYRHFRGKDELLFEVVRDALASISATVRELHDTADLAAAALTHRRLGVLWQRESRHLDPARRELLRADLVGIYRAVRGYVARRRPELDSSDVDLLAWAALAAATSVSFQRIQLATAEYRRLLTAVLDDVLRVNLNAPLEALAPPPAPAAADRRAELIAAAAPLFAERGFHNVGVDDVGTAVGISGPSIYHHFATKHDLVVAVMNDGAQTLAAATSAALATADSDRETLAGLLRSYAGFTFVHSALIDVLITETAQLAEPSRTEFHEVQRAYLDRWLKPLARLYPRRPAAHSRVRLQTTLTLINDIARTAHLRAEPRSADVAATIGLTVLTSDAPT